MLFSWKSFPDFSYIQIRAICEPDGICLFAKFLADPSFKFLINFSLNLCTFLPLLIDFDTLFHQCDTHSENNHLLLLVLNLICASFV